MSEPSVPRLFVGVDWATEKHDVCVEDPAGRVVGERSFPHSGVGLADLVDWLVKQAAGDPSAIWVAIEVPHGPVVETLIERGLRVHAINPKQLDRFRDRFTVAGAKDDRRDARVLADSLRTDPQAFRALTIDAPQVIELREWSRMADDLQQERNRLSNRLREQLRRFFPQALDVANDMDAEWFLDLLEIVPTPAAAQRNVATRVGKVLRKHRVRRLTVDEVLARLRQPAVTVAPGTTEAATAHIRLVSERLRVLHRQLDECHRRLDEICASLPAGESGSCEGQGGEQRDAEILRSLPGVGRIVLATLLAEASQPLKERDYHALRSLTGVAPVTRRSGKRTVVIMRTACHPRLRRAVYHWARVAAQHDLASKVRYRELRSRGHSHGRALRAIADRLLAVAVAMLKSRSLYDPLRAGRHAQEAAA